MLETADLILDKAKVEDYKLMHQNVWSHKEISKYTIWRVSESEDDSKDRIVKTIAFQKVHDTYFVYEKGSGEPIGFAGVEKVSDGVYEEAGICLGPAYTGKGYGKQILKCLIDYCKDKYNAKEFLYSCHQDNLASNCLALSFGFEKYDEEVRIFDGQEYLFIHYRLIL